MPTKGAAKPKQGAAERFAALFEANRRTVGRFDPKRDRSWVEDRHVTIADFYGHLDGTTSIGLVPVQDDDTCIWGAIDIDDHDSDEDIPLKPLDEIIIKNKLPLVLCRSKSGSAHAYLFLEKPQPATKIRVFLTKWAITLGHGGSEIFPKQGKLTVGPEGRNKGNWINLPYQGGDETMRYAVHDGKRLNLEEFLKHAEKRRVTDSDLRALSSGEHPDAPPCIQKMMAAGVAQGHRNEALYNIVVYYKKSLPDGFEAKAIEANTSVFARPLPRAESNRTIGSASRGECQYRCNEEPMRSLCERDVCLTRKFGITPADAERLSTVEALPMFSDLTKYLTEPVRWEFKIDGIKIGNVSTAQLLDWKAMRENVAERLTKVVPMIKNQEWERILIPLMKEARIVAAPEDASTAGAIRSRLKEFASKCDVMNKGMDPDDRKALLRGLPCIQEVDGERCVVFRGQDFINYLKRTKSEELKGVNLWWAIKEMGVRDSRMRIPNAKAGENNIQVWHFPIEKVLVGGEHNAEVKKFRSEL